MPTDDEKRAAEAWQERSRDNLRAAELLYLAQCWPACVTRCYYAAYQAATGICVLHGDVDKFPPDWNNPTHEQLPELIRNNGHIDMEARRRILRLLRYLRRMREDADYRPGRTVDRSDALVSLRNAISVLGLLGLTEETP